jgi:hypothetical protein
MGGVFVGKSTPGCKGRVDLPLPRRISAMPPRAVTLRRIATYD